MTKVQGILLYIYIYINWDYNDYKAYKYIYIYIYVYIYINPDRNQALGSGPVLALWGHWERPRCRTPAARFLPSAPPHNCPLSRMGWRMGIGKNGKNGRNHEKPRFFDGSIKAHFFDGHLQNIRSQTIFFCFLFFKAKPCSAQESWFWSWHITWNGWLKSWLGVPGAMVMVTEETGWDASLMGLSENNVPNDPMVNDHYPY